MNYKTSYYPWISKNKVKIDFTFYKKEKMNMLINSEKNKKKKKFYI